MSSDDHKVGDLTPINLDSGLTGLTEPTEGRDELVGVVSCAASSHSSDLNEVAKGRGVCTVPVLWDVDRVAFYARYCCANAAFTAIASNNSTAPPKKEH